MNDPYEHSVVAPDGHLLTPGEYPLPSGELYLGTGIRCDCTQMYHRTETDWHHCLVHRGMRDSVTGIYAVKECHAVQWYEDERTAEDIRRLVGDAFNASYKPEINGQRIHYKDWVLRFNDGGILVMSDEAFHIMFYEDLEAGDE